MPPQCIHCFCDLNDEEKAQGAVCSECVDYDNFLDEIFEELVILGLSCEEADAKLADAKLPHGELIFHEHPAHWAAAIYYGRRDYWREHGSLSWKELSERKLDPQHLALVQDYLRRKHERRICREGGKTS